MFKKYNLVLNLLILGTIFPLTACSTGEPIKGEPGKNGIDGSKIYTDIGSPFSSVGVVGDMYIDTYTGDVYSKGQSGWIKTGNIKGNDGADGKGIVSVEKTSSDGNVDTYTITFTDGTTTTFTVTNGKDGKDAESDEINYVTKTYTLDRASWKSYFGSLYNDIIDSRIDYSSGTADGTWQFKSYIEVVSSTYLYFNDRVPGDCVIGTSLADGGKYLDGAQCIIIRDYPGSVPNYSFYTTPYRDEFLKNNPDAEEILWSDTEVDGRCFTIAVKNEDTSFKPSFPDYSVGLSFTLKYPEVCAKSLSSYFEEFGTNLYRSRYTNCALA